MMPRGSLSIETEQTDPPGSVAPYVVAALAVAAVLVTGLLSPQAMVGDEVTHFYMLTGQAEQLPTPTYVAEIPTGWGDVERRWYAHPNLWHYLGAVVYTVFGRSFAAVQVYQALFLGQMLVIAMLLARTQGFRAGPTTAYVLVLASLPMSLLFSVAFYQDVAVTAQVLTAFYLLRRSQWLPASVFMGLALLMKVTAVLFLPPFALLALAWGGRDLPSGGRRWGTLLAMAGVLAAAVVVISWSLKTYADTRYYPLHRAKKVLERWCPDREPADASADMAVSSKTGDVREDESASARGYLDDVIANHPGDLRRPVNLLIYGGGVLCVVALLGALGLCLADRRATPGIARPASMGWLWAVGLWFAVLVAIQARSAPDARFFLPAIPFLVLPLVNGFCRLPFPRVLLAGIALVAVLQSAAVLHRVHGLRDVSPDLRAVIEHLDRNAPVPAKVFMYPEGNYRLFPCEHDWYLGYRLRDFWRGDNETRLRLLNDRGIGAVVVKKHLIGDPGPEMHNLGVYPSGFVEDLRCDPSFVRAFENDAAVVFLVPPPL